MESIEDEYTHFAQRLVAVVHECPLIYDKKHALYFNKSERDKAWIEIAAKVGQSVDDCQRRWKLLREKFAKEYKKRKGGSEYETSFSFFEKMHFLTEHIAPRKRTKRYEMFINNPIVETKRNANTAIRFPRSYVSKVITQNDNNTNIRVAKYLCQRKEIGNPTRLSNSEFSSTNMSAITYDSSETDIKEEPIDTSAMEQQNASDDNVNIFYNDERHFSDASQEPLSPEVKLDSYDEKPRHVNNEPPTVSDSDVVFGKLVTSMLNDIPYEKNKDDAKLLIMQLLIKAKRMPCTTLE